MNIYLKLAIVFVVVWILLFCSVIIWLNNAGSNGTSYGVPILWALSAVSFIVFLIFLVVGIIKDFKHN